AAKLAELERKITGHDDAIRQLVATIRQLMHLRKRKAQAADRLRPRVRLWIWRRACSAGLRPRMTRADRSLRFRGSPCWKRREARFWSRRRTLGTRVEISVSWRWAEPAGRVAMSLYSSLQAVLN